MPLTLPDPTPTRSETAGRCIVTKRRENLPEDDKAQLDGWLADEQGVAAWRIAAAISTGTTAIKDHRGMRCRCYQGTTA